MGPTVAKDCAESPEVSQVVACDIDRDKLDEAEKFVDSPKFRADKLDASDHEALVERMKGFDIAVNATAARFSMPVLEAAMEAGVGVVDLAGGGYPLDGELFTELLRGLGERGVEVTETITKSRGL